jgi:dTDP-4-dehydrorhamnose reductase
VRLSKVFGSWPPLFACWRDAWRERRTAEAFANMVAAPVTDSLAARVLGAVGCARAAGVYQFSGDRDISYVAMAQRIADRLGVAPDYVVPVTGTAAGFDAGQFPRHTTLDSGRVSREFGIDAPDVWTVIDEVTT